MLKKIYTACFLLYWYAYLMHHTIYTLTILQTHLYFLFFKNLLLFRNYLNWPESVLSMKKRLGMQQIAPPNLILQCINVRLVCLQKINFSPYDTGCIRLKAESSTSYSVSSLCLRLLKQEWQDSCIIFLCIKKFIYSWYEHDHNIERLIIRACIIPIWINYPMFILKSNHNHTYLQNRCHIFGNTQCFALHCIKSILQSHFLSIKH